MKCYIGIVCAMYLASYIYIDVLLAPYLVFTSPIFYSSSLIGFHSKEKKSIFRWKQDLEASIKRNVKFVEMNWSLKNF